MQLSYVSSQVTTRTENISQHMQSTRHKVSGRVLCFNESFPLEGVTVREKNSGTETKTLADGSWDLELLPGKKTMEFEMAGYVVQRVHVNRPLPFQVVLKREFNPMQNLVYSSLSAHQINR